MGAFFGGVFFCMFSVKGKIDSVNEAVRLRL